MLRSGEVREMLAVYNVKLRVCIFMISNVKVGYVCYDHNNSDEKKISFERITSNKTVRSVLSKLAK